VQPNLVAATVTRVPPRSRAPRSRWLARAGLAAAVLAGGVLGAPAGRPAALAAAPAARVPDGAAPVRIMPLGDSLTWGKGSSGGSGYRADLFGRLTAAGVAVDFVGTRHTGAGADADHEGYPGWRIDQIADHVDDWLAQDAPDVVLLDIGTNDYVQHRDLPFTTERLAGLIDRILADAPNARIVVAKLLVIAGAERSLGVEAFNAALPWIAARHADRVTVADMSRISAASTVDGVHPRDAGYRQMAYQWFQALRGVLPGGAAWPATADPFPLPSVSLARSDTAVRPGGAVTLTARLAGELTRADLGGVPVRLLYRRAGTSAWRTLAAARTAPSGRAVFQARVAATGSYAVTVAAGRAAGRTSRPVEVAAR
jgi:lysophospholipase L1-like esterase